MTPAMSMDDARRGETVSLGMWLFIASEVLFFGAVFVAYGMARLHSPEGFAAASARTDVVIGSVNTAVLLTSSLAVAIGAEAAAGGRRRLAQWGLATAVVLGAAFLVAKGVEYQKEWHQHLFPGRDFALPQPGAQLFFMWYFTITALHALHLAIGMAFTAHAAWRTPTDGPRVHAIGLYWHFVDVVWIFLYPMIYLVAPRS